MSDRGTFVRVCTIAALFCALSGAAACKEPKQPPVGVGGPVDTAEQVGFGVRTLLTGNGVQRGELMADTMFIFNDQTKFDFRNARVKFNTETGAANGTMRADRGIYDSRTQILEGFGNVVVTSVDGKQLKSPHLKFNQLANEVSSDTTFEMAAGDKMQTGIGFKSDPNLKRFSCQRACNFSGKVAIPAQ
jgi:LPS export ABC transporter protein LptC